MKNIAILGSTGSIGRQTLDIVDEQGDIKVVAMSCKSSLKIFEEQIRKFKPELVAVWDGKDALYLRTKLKDTGVKVSCGMKGLIDVATYESADYVVTAIVGMIGIRPTIAAIEAGKQIALANKETLVCAGHIIMPLAAERGVPILPVDSEHSAIFQSLNGEESNPIYKILLTASGGPFRGFTKEQLQEVTLAQALKHPNWSMGKKITIDSSTLVNKGLEVMEAHWLFDVPYDQIEVYVHPQSVIHSAVEYEDGAVIAQLGSPDMHLPIQYALYYPERRPSLGKRLNLFDIGQLTFEKPDMEAFEGLKLAYDAMHLGGNAPTVFNAANERAVAMFLEEKIKYPQITEIIGEALANVVHIDDPDIDLIEDTEAVTNDFIDSKWSM